MPEEFEITISGLDLVLENMSKLPKNIVKQAYGKALAAAAVPVSQALAARTPELTGDLKAHQVADIAVDAEGNGGVVQIGFGSQGHVARLVEFGHRMVGHAPNKKEVGSVPQHPFMRPAAAASADEAIEAFADSLRESVDAGIKVA